MLIERKWKQWGSQNRIIIDPILIEAWILNKAYPLQQQQQPPRSLSPLFSISHLLFFPLSISFLTHPSNASLYYPSSNFIHTTSPLRPSCTFTDSQFISPNLRSSSLFVFTTLHTLSAFFSFI